MATHVLAYDPAFGWYPALFEEFGLVGRAELMETRWRCFAWIVAIAVPDSVPVILLRTIPLSTDGDRQVVLREMLSDYIRSKGE